MCFADTPEKPETPAAAPPPPEPPAEAPEIGNARKAENRQNFGSDTPSYRVNRGSSSTSLTSNNQITM